MVSPARFDMPFDVAGAAIEESIRQKLALLKSRLKDSERAGSAKSEAELRSQIGVALVVVRSCIFVS